MKMKINSVNKKINLLIIMLLIIQIVSPIISHATLANKGFAEDSGDVYQEEKLEVETNKSDKEKLDNVYWNPDSEDTYNTDGTIYVRGGNDENKGSDHNSPVLSFDRALELLTDNGTIYIMQTAQVSEDQIIDGKDKNITLTRWSGTPQAQAFTAQMFNIGTGAELTLKNISLGKDEEDVRNRRLIQLVSSSSKLNVLERVTMNGYIYYENPGALVEIKEEPPSQKYDLKFNNNINFNGRTVVNGIDFEISDYIDQYFELEVINVPEDANYKWLLVPSSEMQIEAERRDLYPGIYLNGTEKGNDSNDGLSPERPVKTFKQAQEIAKNNTEREIYISGQVTIRDKEVWTLPEQEYSETKVYRHANYDGNLIKIEDEGKLTLKEIVIDGNKKNVEGKSPGIIIEENGSLKLSDSGILQNFKARDNVSVLWIKENAHFIMENNATIKRSESMYSAAGAVYNSGNMSVVDGTISNTYSATNISTNGAAIFNASEGVLTLDGDTEIKNNNGNSSYNSAAIANRGKMDIKGNTKISDNDKISGLKIDDGGTVKFMSGTIENNRYGIYIDSTSAKLIMTSGEIIDNKDISLYLKRGESVLEGGRIAGSNQAIAVEEEGTYSNYKADLYLDTGMVVEGNIKLNNVFYPIILTEKTEDNAADNQFNIEVDKGSSNGRRGFYSGSKIVIPDKKTLKDVSDKTELFNVQPEYRAAGYEGNIILSNDVYIDGVKGDDNNSGLGPEEAVKTRKKAVEILGQNKNEANSNNTIYVVDNITVNAEEDWTISDSVFAEKGLVIERFQHYLGALVTVEENGDLIVSKTKIKGRAQSPNSNPTIQTVRAESSALYVKGKLSLLDASSVDSSTTNKNGAAIYITETGNVTLKESEINNNSTNTNNGGAIYGEKESTLIAKNTSFINNKSSSNGGAIYSNGKVTIKGKSMLKDNSSDLASHIFLGEDGTLELGTEDGASEVNISEGEKGPIYINGKATMYEGTKIYDNKAIMGKHGVQIDSKGSLTMKGGEIYNNTTRGTYRVDGGGVYVKGEFYLEGGSIYNNNINGYGAGVYIDTDAEFTMTGGEIRENTTKRIGNHPGYDGGGVYLAGKMNFYGGHISNNSAVRDGGGIYVTKDGKLTMGELEKEDSVVNSDIEHVEDIIIDGNQAKINGGAIFNEGIVSLTAGSIKENQAKLGNGIYTAEGNKTTLGGSLSMTAKEDEGETQYIYLSDKENTLYLSEKVEEGLVYTLDMPNVFIGVDVVKPDGNKITDVSDQKAHFVLSKRAITDWVYQLGSSGKNLIIINENSIFIDGVNGDDEREGSSPAEAVKTWTRIKELLEVRDGLEIYITDTVTIDEDSSWSLEEFKASTVKRYGELRSKPLIKIDKGVNFTLSHITIDGGAKEGLGIIANTGSIDVYGKLVLGEESKVENAYIQENDDNPLRKSAVTVYNDAELLMNSGSSINNNFKQSLRNTNSLGGGLYIHSGGQATLKKNSHIKDNKIENGRRWGQGGGVYTLGKLKLEGGSISDNIIDAAYISGGGVDVSGSGSMIIESGKISNNKLFYSSGRNGFSSGGGGVSVKTNGKLKMSGGSIEANKIKASQKFPIGVADVLAGGGVHNSGDFTMSGGVIKNNGFFDDKVDLRIFFTLGSNVFTRNGSFTMNNEATIKGARANTTNRRVTGGGVYWNSGKFTMDGGHIVDNEAHAGGGISLKGSGYGNSGSGVVNLNKGEVSKNTSVENEGGGIQGRATNSTVNIGSDTKDAKAKDFVIKENMGSGLYLLNGTFNINQASIDGNTGRGFRRAGGLHIRSANINLKGTEIINNKAERAAALSIYGNYYGSVTMHKNTTISNNVSESGHNIFIGSSRGINRIGSMKILGGVIKNNKVEGSANTPGIYVEGDLELKGGEIYNNTAEGNANSGAVYVAEDGKFNMSNGKIKNTSVISKGNGVISAGAVYNLGQFTMSGGFIKNNSVKVSGGHPSRGKGLRAVGAIYNGGELEVNGGKIEKNSAKALSIEASNRGLGYSARSAGAVFINETSRSAEITGGEILNNSAISTVKDLSKHPGKTAAVGGLYIDDSAHAIMRDGKIKDNEGKATAGHAAKPDKNDQITKYDLANGVGGILLDYGSRLDLNGGEISGNKKQASGNMEADIIDKDYLKNGIFVGGEDSLFMSGRNLTVNDNIYLSKQGRIITLNASVEGSPLFNIALSPDFNAGDSIVQPDTQTYKAGPYYANFTNSNQKYGVVDGDEQEDVILSKVIFLASYGDDKNDGSTPDNAIATFKRAYELMEFPKHDRIYICGTVHVGQGEDEKLTYGDDVQKWALPKNASLRRYNGFSILGREYDPFLGDLIQVNKGGELNLGVGDMNIDTGDWNSMMIDGYNVPNTEGSIIKVNPGGKLITNNETTLLNNKTTANGAAIRNFGETYIDGGLFTENETSAKGDFVYQSGKLDLKGSLKTGDADVYLASDRDNKGYYIDISDKFTPNKDKQGKLKVNLPLSDAYIYRKIGVYNKELEIPDHKEKVKFDLPEDIMKVYDFENNFKNERILELYRDMSLSIEKELTGEKPDPNKSFTINVKLTDTDDEPISTFINDLPYEIYEMKNNAKVSTGKLKLNEEGVGEFTLKGGQGIMISGIPTDTKYSVSEDYHQGYKAKYDEKRTGLIKHDDLDKSGYIIKGSGNESPKTKITNKAFDYVSLSLEKEVTGNRGDKNKDFEFRITIDDDQTEEYTYIKTKNSIASKIKNTMNLSKDNRKTFKSGDILKLSHGEKVEINNIEKGLAFTIEELNPGDYTQEAFVDRQYEDLTDGKLEEILDKNTEVLYINKLEEIPTGVESKNSKIYLLLIGIALLGLTYLLINRKNKKKQ